jgi:hypothetical protein
MWMIKSEPLSPAEALLVHYAQNAAARIVRETRLTIAAAHGYGPDAEVVERAGRLEIVERDPRPPILEPAAPSNAPPCGCSGS